MIKLEDYPNLKVDEYLSVTKIYQLSKKRNDLEKDMYLKLLYITYQAKNKTKLKFRRSKLLMCRFFWNCIKTSLLLGQDLDDELITIILCIKAVLLKGMTVLNKEFRETQDSEVLNFPDPDKQEYIDKVKSLLSIKHR